jgi:hypothetical protein
MRFIILNSWCKLRSDFSVTKWMLEQEGDKTDLAGAGDWINAQQINRTPNARAGRSITEPEGSWL